MTMVLDWIEIKKQKCLTCQYFKCERRIRLQGQHVLMDYENGNGTCTLTGRLMHCHSSPLSGTSICRYKRWLELPDT